MISRQIKFISTIVIVLTGVISCEGPVGSTGPEGEQGPRGEEGATGSANVTSYLFTDLEWASTTKAINIFYDENFNIPEEVKEEGVVLFYVKFDVSPFVWWPAPAPYVLAGTEGYSIVATFGNGAIALLLRNSDGSQIPTPQEVIDLAALRVVVVPPGTVIPAKMPSGFWEDYEAVAEYFGIRD